jgi:hypothetical protein
MRALQTEEDWTEVLATSSRIEALNVRRSADQEASDLLSRFFAESFLDVGDHELLTHLRRLAADDSLTSATRLTAAMLGMAASDNAYDADGLRAFYEQAAGMRPDSTQARLAGLKCQVIYETALGSFDAAEAAACDLIAVANATCDDAELCSALKFAHYPPRRTGNFALARQRLEQAMAIATRHKRLHAKATVSDVLAGTHLDYGLYDIAVSFTRDVTDHAERLGGVFRQQSALDTRAQALLFLDRAEEARSIIHAPDAILARGRRRPQFMNLASTSLLATYDRNAGVIRRCIAAFDEVRDRLFKHAGADSIAIAYARGLAYTQSTAAAEEFVQWYLSVARRDTLPAPNLLIRAAEP